MDTTLFSVLVSAVLAVVSVGLGGEYLKLKKLLKGIIAAAEDDEVTEEEFQEIVTGAKALLNQ